MRDSIYCTSGYFWMPPDNSDYLWLPVDTYDNSVYLWMLVDISDYLWLPMTAGNALKEKSITLPFSTNLTYTLLMQFSLLTYKDLSQSKTYKHLFIK